MTGFCLGMCEETIPPVWAGYDATRGDVLEALKSIRVLIEIGHPLFISGTMPEGEISASLHGRKVFYAYRFSDEDETEMWAIEADVSVFEIDGLF